MDRKFCKTVPQKKSGGGTPKPSSPSSTSLQQYQKLDILIGISVRPDSFGHAHTHDLNGISGAKLLFNKNQPICIGISGQEYSVNVVPVPIPKLPQTYQTWAKSIDSSVQDWASALGSKKEVPNTKTDVGKKSTGKLHEERANFNPADLNGIDLLYIPGAPVAARSQQGDSHKMKATTGFKLTEADSRDAFEAKIIEVAMNRGIPILAVCAGSWRLIESYGGQVRELSPTEIGTHHNSANVWSCHHLVNVLSKQEAPGLVTSIAHAHGLDIGKDRRQLQGVNSTHWAVTDVQHSVIQEGENKGRIDPTKATFTKRQTGHGQTSDSLDPSQLLKPVAFEKGTYTVEAFESSFGVPIVGTQWHPESFLPGMKGSSESYADQTTIRSSGEIFRLLILAAVASKVKRLSVVPELREIFQKGGPKLRHVVPVVKKAMCVFDPGGPRNQLEAVDIW